MARWGGFAVGGVLIALAGASGPATAAPDGVTVMPMTSIVRACDFSVAEHTWRTGYARPLAYLHRDSSDSVSVEVRLLTAVPNAEYFVKVFPMPRASADCGVAPIGLRTDGAGAATVTVQTPTGPDVTGVWVSIERPSPYSQQPAEVYTSDFIAPV